MWPIEEWIMTSFMHHPPSPDLRNVPGIECSGRLRQTRSPPQLELQFENPVVLSTERTRWRQIIRHDPKTTLGSHRERRFHQHGLQAFCVNRRTLPAYRDSCPH